jgi:hypothetical protein
MLWKNKILGDSFILEVWGLPSVKTLWIDTPLLALRRSFVKFAEFLGTDVGFVRVDVLTFGRLLLSSSRLRYWTFVSLVRLSLHLL